MAFLQLFKMDLIHGILKGFTWCEPSNSLSLDFDRFAGLRITACTSFHFSYFKSTETDKCNSPLFLSVLVIVSKLQATTGWAFFFVITPSTHFKLSVF